ncbi:uncharacterized protein LOC117780804 isoform X2 [Drosophila innubila]|uniref:uncharacterized protein LOC117780804 isoform X2 n=1 Tax=Drosophila innubila TaxID=198719 RepID=UPI00148C233A|nr:uncharacterized protein LOC117780804 isoform X2 [Drosophila innubila]
MLSLLITIANAIDVALIQPITNIIDSIAAAVYYFFAGSCFIGYCLIQGAGFIWRCLCQFYEVATIVFKECSLFYGELRLVVCDVFDYIYYGTGDGLQLARNISKGIVIFLSNVLIELGNFTLWMLLLLPRAIIAILDYLLLGLQQLGSYVVEIGTHLLHNLFRLSIGIVVLLVLYMYRGYVYICETWTYTDQKLSWLLQKFEVGAPQQSDSSSVRTDQCVVCLERRRNIVLLPCRHLCMCKECSQQLPRFEGGDRCPICRDLVETVMAVYS